MKCKKVFSLVLVAVLLVGLVACQNGTKEGNENDGTKLTWWTTLFPHVAQTATNFGDVELYKELEKRTGVDLEFIHPPTGQESEAFNIMLASGEYPDLMTWNFTTYKGGAQKAIDDGVIINLDEHLPKAKNYSKLLEENPEWNKEVVTDNGSHYTFALFYGDDTLTCWFGPQVRKDLLDKAGLELPETIQEWDTMLRKFKEMGVPYPLTLTGTNFDSTFTGGFGIGENFYQENGIAKHGVLEPAYKDYLKQMNTWYKDGLLDPDFFAQDGKTFEAKITTGKVGAYIGAVGGALGKYLPVLKSVDASYDISGAKFITDKKGELPRFGVKTWNHYPQTSVSVSAQCKNIDAAIRLLDYGYSDEGHMLYNFGIEGVSYNMEGDYPKYTDEILKNPDGLSVQHAMGKYLGAVYGGPFVQDKRYFEQYSSMDQQQEAVKLWADQKAGTRMPPISFNVEESEIIAEKTATVESFLSESLLKIITGKTPIEEFDGIVAQARKMGLDEMVNAYQQALDRYNNR